MFLLVLAIIFLVGLLAVAGAGVAFSIYQSSWRRIGYIPLPDAIVPNVIDALEVETSQQVRLYDLGCGDGRILASAFSKNPNLSAVGIELNPVVAKIARRKLRSEGSRAQIIRGDLFKLDLKPATHVFFYLSDPMADRLEPKLERELRPGTRVVACDFPLPKRKPNRIIEAAKAGLGQRLFVYDF